MTLRKKTIAGTMQRRSRAGNTHSQPGMAELTALFQRLKERLFLSWIRRKSQNNSYLSLTSNSSSHQDSNSSKCCGKLRQLQRLVWSARRAISTPCSLLLPFPAKNKKSWLTRWVPHQFRKSLWRVIAGQSRKPSLTKLLVTTAVLWINVPFNLQLRLLRFGSKGNWQSSKTVLRLLIRLMDPDQRNIVAMKVASWKECHKY